MSACKHPLPRQSGHGLLHLICLLLTRSGHREAPFNTGASCYDAPVRSVGGSDETARFHIAYRWRNGRVATRRTRAAVRDADHRLSQQSCPR